MTSAASALALSLVERVGAPRLSNDEAPSAASALALSLVERVVAVSAPVMRLVQTSAARPGRRP